jgi:hypothetical protein
VIVDTQQYQLSNEYVRQQHCAMHVCVSNREL